MKISVVSLSLILDRAFQIGVIEALAEYVQQVVKTVKDAPGGTNAEISSPLLLAVSQL